MATETYLGDGCYASFDGYQIKLRAPRESEDHVIYLEPAVFEALVEYQKRLTSARPMSDEQIEATAKQDKDNLPWEKP